MVAVHWRGQKDSRVLSSPTRPPDNNLTMRYSRSLREAALIIADPVPRILCYSGYQPPLRCDSLIVSHVVLMPNHKIIHCYFKTVSFATAMDQNVDL